MKNAVLCGNFKNNYIHLRGIPDLVKPEVHQSFQRVSNAEIHHWSCHGSKVRDQIIDMKV